MKINLQWRIVLFLIPLPVVLALYFVKKSDPLFIVDPKTGFDSTKYSILIYTDSLKGGQSSLELLHDTSNELSYSYILENKVSAPMVRLLIASKTLPFFDFSPYNTLIIRLKSDKGKQLPIVLCNAIPYYSRPDDINTYHLAINYVGVSPQFQTRELALKEFTTPDWWYAFASNKQYQNTRPQIDHVKYIFLANSSYSSGFNKDTVHISELRFEYSFNPFFIRAAIGAFIYYLICLALFYFPKVMYVEMVYLWYKKIDTVNYEEASFSKIKNYLHENFQNPELTISEVQNETGIHQKKISAILKKESQLTFKAYLNQLRMEKAKGLLKDTDLPIAAISVECGYNSVTHFNRVFKSEHQVSPLEFRSDQKSPIS